MAVCTKTSKVFKKMVEVDVSKDVYQLELNKDEMTLIGAMVGHINGCGYWRNISDNMFFAIVGQFRGDELRSNPGVNVPLSIDVKVFDKLPKENVNG